MRERIGRVADRVCDALEERGALTLPALCEAIDDASPIDVVMALGWLSHEDRVFFGSRSMALKVMTRTPRQSVMAVPSGSPGRA